MNDLFRHLDSIFTVSQDVLLRSGTSALVIVSALVLRAVVVRLVSRRIDRPKTLFFIRRVTSYVVFFLVALVLLSIWFEGLSGLPTYLGLLSAGLAIAFKDPIANMIAWVYILSTRLFTVGERVQIGADTGDVIDIQVFRTVMLEVGNWVEADQTTGRIMYVPNARVFTETVSNYHQGFPYIWHEVSLTLTFQSDWQKAKRLFLEALNRRGATLYDAMAQSLRDASRQFYIDQKNYLPAVFLRFREYGIVATLRYLCDPRSRRQTEHDLTEDLLGILAREPDINLAYPTQRLFGQGVDRDPSTP